MEEVADTIPEIKLFLKSELLKLIKLSNYDEILSSHIHPLIIQEREPIVKGKINQIVSL